MNLTPEQQAIREAAITTKENLGIVAAPGSGKTFSLEMIGKAIIEPILLIAFNKRNADEAAKRLPGHVKCQTIHGLCYGVWSKAIGKRLIVDTGKPFKILKEVIEALPRSQREAAWDNTGDILQYVRLAKSAGYLPPGFEPARGLVDEIPSDDFIEPFIQQIVDAVLTKSIHTSYNGQVDFDDMLLMSTLFQGHFPNYPIVMVDEAQDLSGLNHAMLKKLVRQRLIIVGDPFQSLYAFRGAVSKGMEQLIAQRNCRVMPLSVNFRSAKLIIERARFRLPSMQWRDDAPEGEIKEFAEWSVGDVPENAAIVCRNNAPLFKLALKFIREGKAAKLLGSDIGPGLVRVLKKLGDDNMRQGALLSAIDSWEEGMLQKSKSPGSIADRAECLRVFANAGPDLRSSVTYAEAIFAANGRVEMSSIHKSKGLEWDTVVHLDPWRIPSPYAEGEEALDQELNCRYVAETRPKHTLITASMESFT